MLNPLRIFTGHCHASNLPSCRPNNAPYSPATVHGSRGTQGPAICNPLACFEKFGTGPNSAAVRVTAKNKVRIATARGVAVDRAIYCSSITLLKHLRKSTGKLDTRGGFPIQINMRIHMRPQNRRWTMSRNLLAQRSLYGAALASSRNGCDQFR